MSGEHLQYVGFVYGYQDSTGAWVFVDGARDPMSRHASRLRQNKSDFDRALKYTEGTHEALRGPLLLERVEGVSAPDLAFNLLWQQTVWMTKLKTCFSFFGTGYNLDLPDFGRKRVFDQFGTTIANGFLDRGDARWGLSKNLPLKLPSKFLRDPVVNQQRKLVVAIRRVNPKWPLLLRPLDEVEAFISRSERAKKFWLKPEYRARQLEIQKKLWGDSNFRARHSAAQKIRFSDPALRAKISLATKVGMKKLKGESS